MKGSVFGGGGYFVKFCSVETELLALEPPLPPPEDSFSVCSPLPSHTRHFCSKKEKMKTMKKEENTHTRLYAIMACAFS